MPSSQPLVEKATFNWCNDPGLPHWDNPIKNKLVRTTMKTTSQRQACKDDNEDTTSPYIDREAK